MWEGYLNQALVTQVNSIVSKNIDATCCAYRSIQSPMQEPGMRAWTASPRKQGLRLRSFGAIHFLWVPGGWSLGALCCAGVLASSKPWNTEAQNDCKALCNHSWCTLNLHSAECSIFIIYGLIGCPVGLMLCLCFLSPLVLYTSACLAKAVKVIVVYLIYKPWSVSMCAQDTDMLVQLNGGVPPTTRQVYINEDCLMSLPQFCIIVYTVNYRYMQHWWLTKCLFTRFCRPLKSL